MSYNRKNEFKILRECKDYNILLDNLTYNQMKNIENVLEHYLDAFTDINEYIFSYGNADIINWYEGILSTKDFIKDYKASYDFDNLSHEEVENGSFLLNEEKEDKSNKININGIVDDYYSAIIDIEDFFENSDFSFAKRIDKLSTLSKKICNIVDDMYKTECMPWQSINGDIKDGLYAIFNSFNINEIIPYLKVGDIITDMEIDYIEEDLTNYYKNRSADINDDSIKEKIIDKAFDFHFQDELDSNIFSKDTIKVHKIGIKITDVCDCLYKYFKNKDNENIEEVQI